jgi:hypothetical protein
MIELKVETKITLELTAGEAGALQAICGYGPDIFIEWFHRTHGKHYLEPYRSHVKSLFEKGKALSADVRKVESDLKQLAQTLPESVKLKR